MSVYKIVVEGKDDIVFLLRLITIMRGDETNLKWQGIQVDNKVDIRGSRFGNSYVELKNDIVAIEELRGVYIGEMPPSLKIVKTKNRELRIDHLIGIFDADSETNFLGHKVNHGGLPNRREYIERRFSSWTVKKKFFFMPDDDKNGAMEDLMLNAIRPEFRFIVEDYWPAYRRGVKGVLTREGIRSLGYSAKCTLSQFSAILDEDVAKDLYWLDSLFNDNLWDWDNKALQPLRSFLRLEVPCLFQ